MARDRLFKLIAYSSELLHEEEAIGDVYALGVIIRIAVPACVTERVYE
jgi:hypothetical protein